MGPLASAWLTHSATERTKQCAGAHEMRFGRQRCSSADTVLGTMAQPEVTLRRTWLTCILLPQGMHRFGS